MQNHRPKILDSDYLAMLVNIIVCYGSVRNLWPSKFHQHEVISNSTIFHSAKLLQAVVERWDVLLLHTHCRINDFHQFTDIH